MLSRIDITLLSHKSAATKSYSPQFMRSQLSNSVEIYHLPLLPKERGGEKELWREREVEGRGRKVLIRIVERAAKVPNPICTSAENLRIDDGVQE